MISSGSCCVALQEASVEDEDFQFLDSQLLLFGKMCQVCVYPCRLERD